MNIDSKRTRMTERKGHCTLHCADRHNSCVAAHVVYSWAEWVILSYLNPYEHTVTEANTHRPKALNRISSESQDIRFTFQRIHTEKGIEQSPHEWRVI